MSKNYLSQYYEVAIALALLALVALACVEIGTVSAESQGEPVASPDASPKTKTTSNIERGRYLVKITGCNDCHTPGYVSNAGRVDESQWLIGDRLGFQGPWGTTYPANLRQFVATLTREQWLQVARQPTRPPMPWFALRDMSDDDLAAIYDYISALGPAGSAVPPYVPPGEKVEGPFVKFPSS